jgi:hypothetical protein
VGGIRWNWRNPVDNAFESKVLLQERLK